MITNLEELRKRADEAKREWEELDPQYTSFEMRKKAERRYLSLRELLFNVEPLNASKSTQYDPEKWRTMADKALSGKTAKMR